MRKNLKKIATLAMAAAMAIAVVPAVPTQAAKTELIKMGQLLWCFIRMG